MKNSILMLGLFLVIAITGCSDKDQDNKRSSPTMGNLVIGIDESLRPVTDPELHTFSVFYPNTRIEPLYLPEKEVVEKLLSNEIQVGIICRDLYDEEAEVIKTNYQHTLQTFKLAEDEIVAAVSSSSPVNEISYNDIKKILAGEITDWRQINPAFNEELPVVVVMTASSSVNRYFYQINGSSVPIQSYALGNTDEVIDYVKNNVAAIGILGGSWFYQKGNKYPDVKLVPLRKETSTADGSTEPLYREVYGITHEPFTGLGTGFISFLASQKGQMILEKAGMTPYKPISREIELTDHFIQY
jgi:phosphate transport system substrate-binding protein